MPISSKPRYKRSTLGSISKELNRDLLRDELDEAERNLAKAHAALKVVQGDAWAAGLRGDDHWSLQRVKVFRG